MSAGAPHGRVPGEHVPGGRAVLRRRRRAQRRRAVAAALAAAAVATLLITWYFAARDTPAPGASAAPDTSAAAARDTPAPRAAATGRAPGPTHLLASAPRRPPADVPVT